MNHLISVLEGHGIEIYEDASSAKSARTMPEVGEQIEVESKKEAIHGEDAELDLTPGLLDKNSDPVRM